MNTPNTEKLSELLRPSLEQLGLDLLSVQFLGRGGRGSILRLTVDRRGGGVDLDDCERASKAASAVLDAYDPIAGSYSLEVSSPGAERPITTSEEWLAALGRRVNIRYRVGESELIVEGRLMARGTETLEVEVREGNRRRAVIVPAEAVVAARIAVDI